MLLSWLLNRKPSRRGSARPRLGVEPLEDRIDPATVTVSPLAPDGTPHSLRDVLATLNPDESNTILLTPGTLKLTQGQLQVTGMKGLTIKPLLSDPVTIDGGGQSRDLEIDGSS